ncbi:rhodanese-like domain-containing protein [Synechocystis sp. LKSZ1]|uniref:rhodanese-like domain-containing protein n=1 Tax=Synechocystis sp. LKSZ1 TaxID=3144951 RepID=UPI00336C1ACF
MTSIQVPTNQTIDVQTLRQLIEQDSVVLVDVREPLEYAGERIADAKLMPLSQFRPQELPWAAGKSLVLYCQSSHRSGQALKQAQNFGEEGVLHLQGGLTAWKQAGFPTIKRKNAPISIMRQVQIIAGTLVLTGTILGALVSPYFLLLSGFVGAGLTFAGLSGTCMMANLLGKLPYNQVK